MPISGDYNYADKLALDKAKLIGRTRINDLGAYELTVQYNIINSKMREEALEWLEANRLEITDPEISFKVYEGTWQCISIGYNEDRSIITQVFKTDVGVGNLGNTGEEPDYSLQTGDLSRISDGMEVYRAYYWRVSNPNNYELPLTPIEGEIWTKTANDNGDGTYDITISKEVKQNQEGGSDTFLWGETGTQNREPSTSIFISGANREVGFNQEYALYYEYFSLRVVGAGAITGLDEAQFYDTGSLYAGLPIYKDSTDAYANWSDGTDYYITTTANIGNTSASSRLKHDEIEGVYQGFGGWSTSEYSFLNTFVHTVGTPDTTLGPVYAEWRGVENHFKRILYDVGIETSTWSIRDVESTIIEYAYHPYRNLNSSEWYYGETAVYDENLIVQIGRNPPASTETTTVFTSTGEYFFESVGGANTVPDPIEGEEKTIQNTPLENGLFLVTISSRIANRQRIPTLFDSIVYASAGNVDKNAIIGARNTSYEEFQRDLNYMRVSKTSLQNSVSVSINRFGLLDYTIRSIEV